jgi:hypothetical protein
LDASAVFPITPRDVGHAPRLMRRQPGFSLVAIITTALGIGANV